MAQPSVTDLLDEEELRFEPVSAPFDTDAIAAHVEALGFAFRDRTRPDMIVVAATEEGRDAFRAQRDADPQGGFPSVLLVSVKPDEVIVAPGTGEGLAEVSTGLLTWLARSFPCRAFNDHGTDVTALLAADPTS
jgi:hypothetical protein